MAQQETYIQTVKRRLKKIWSIFLSVIVLAFVAEFAYGCYEGVDKDGLIPHTENVTLVFRGEWLNGETRDCTADNTDLYSGHLSTLYCPLLTETQPAHQIDIKFWGQVKRPGIYRNQPYWNWHCKRGEDGFTCYAVN